MIITKKVSKKINLKNIQHFKNKGYECELKDIIEVRPIDLTHGNTCLILVKCDLCGKEKLLTECQFNFLKKKCM
jgi:hypothetical protein